MTTVEKAPIQKPPVKSSISERVRGERRLGMYLTLPSYLVMILVTGGIGDGVNETDSVITSITPSTNKAMDFIRYPMVLLGAQKDSASVRRVSPSKPAPGSIA